MGEHELAGAVADGVDAVNVGAHVFVDRDGSALGEFDARVLEAIALDARGEADGGEELVCFEDLLVATLRRGDGHLDARTGVFDLLDLGASEDLDPHLLVVLGEFLRDLLILGRDHSVEELDHGDLGAVLTEHIGEFGADGAGTADDDGGGDLVGEDLFLVGHDVVGHLDTRKQLRRGACGDDAVVEGDGLGRAVLLLDLDRLGVLEGAPAVDLLDLVLLHQEVDALGHPLRDLAAAGERLLVVHRDLTLDAELVGLRVEDLGEFGVAHQSLRRDTADVEADATPVFVLDDGNLLAHLGRPDGGDVPTGARAKDNCVEMRAHVSNSSRVAGCSTRHTNPWVISHMRLNFVK